MSDDEVRSGVGWRKGVPTYSRGGGFWELLENPVFDDEVRFGVGWRKGVPTYSRGGGFWELLENPVSDDEVSAKRWSGERLLFVCLFVCLFPPRRNLRTCPRR